MKIRQGLFRWYLKQGFLLFDYLLWLLFDPTKFKKIDRRKIKNVLVIHLGAIGELLASTALIARIKNNLNCKIDYLLLKGREPIFEDNPRINKILLFNKESMKDNIENLKKGDYDLAIIISPASLKISRMCRKIGIKYIIGGFGGLSRFPTFLYTRRNFPLGMKHSLKRGFDILNPIKVYYKNPKIEVYFSKEARGGMEKKLKKLRIKTFAIVHPGFGQAAEGNTSKKWESGRYSEIIDYLIEKYKIDVLVTGVRNEREFINEIIKNVKNKERVRDASDIFSLKEFFALIQKARIMIAPDTGAGHAAAALGVPLINIMGIISPEEWSPLGNKKRIINLYKRKYYLISFKGIKKIGGINDNSVNEVKWAIDKLIKN